MFGKGCEYEYITNNIQILLSHVQSTNSKKNGEPHLKTIRWDSLYKCVKYITENKKPFFENSDNIEINQCFDEIEKKITWDILKKILETMWHFIQFIERDHTNLADLMKGYLITYHELKRINTEESLFLAEKFHQRFSDTCPIDIPSFCLLMTKDGLIYLKNNSIELEEKIKILDLAHSGLKRYLFLRKINEKVTNTVLADFDRYLEECPINFFSDHMSAFENWSKLKTDLANFACEILSIPCTEAAVERLFSFLSSITSSSMYNSSLELIESRLMIHFDSLFRKIGPIDIKNITLETFTK